MSKYVVKWLRRIDDEPYLKTQGILRDDPPKWTARLDDAAHYVSEEDARASLVRSGVAEEWVGSVAIVPVRKKVRRDGVYVVKWRSRVGALDEPYLATIGRDRRGHYEAEWVSSRTQARRFVSRAEATAYTIGVDPDGQTRQMWPNRTRIVRLVPKKAKQVAA